ncbi:MULTISPECIES: P27 family phage terminase small subunit [unclassified Bradyrhizobium]|uniref:P27 family phage terminase small subunit n=1 Tax=unclassified Bradyrhizobium TaxID=2631580 RepID=UPI001BA52B8A|nr:MULTISPECIES: P27 family phage terminase small subunit [unclassified Bradyrhizobium]WLA52361.1 P27 family phage terminase small subunit [Bradyrhizobium elkanii]MBR1206973.1 P27 family phage terminase small subunit [Bradyrhizobium sp. AUGA SZCCT0124]MBR1313512.1 P27 family phage terminase small subunit [Bradyrhizobium sp. AUGA SZCCT0051]MBR1343391.1 P27 family phage terminase small subunit [Bradyrhizobium sp. AUGA SZCCT0105]MBR1357189.1 P27 family phage terminase small subunit [Bradyrhizobiu
MRGAKPKLRNVVPMRPDDQDAAKRRRSAQLRLINKLKPKGLSPELLKEYRRVAEILSEPSVDRLKPRFLDTIVEYCRSTQRLNSLRSAMPTLAHEIYRVKTRNGDQVKSHPYVAQVNEEWRKWRSLVAMLGLSPTDERNLLPGQGDFFDENDGYFD